MANPTANAYFSIWNGFEHRVLPAPHNATGHILNIPTENLRRLCRQDELLHLRVNVASNLVHHCLHVCIQSATTVKQGFLGNDLQSKFLKTFSSQEKIF